MTNDSGNTWRYPSTMIKNLQTNIDPTALSAVLDGASCTGSVDKSVCIGVGQWRSDVEEQFIFPLVAVGTHNGASWTYPKSVFTDLPARIDPNLKNALFKAASCFGSGTDNSVCIASGSYFTQQLTSPLIGVSSNGGKDWSYPPSIFKNLPAIFGPHFQSANFFGASCTGSGSRAVCIAAGGVYNGEGLPFLALTQNGGNNWSYPASLFTDLTLKIGDENTYPLTAISRDRGRTWIYPPYIFRNLTKTIAPNFVNGRFFKVGTSGGNYRK